MNHAAESALLGGAQVVLVVAAAPLLQGLIRKLKARLQYRAGPPLLQGYFDLAKWFSRGELLAGTTSLVHVLAPWVVLGAMLAAVLFVPVFAAAAPLTVDGDFIAVIGLFALARAATALGGMDSGSSFGQMGSSRELAAGALVEPAFVVALAALAIGAGSTRLGEMVTAGDVAGWGYIDLTWALALVAFAVVVVAETGRIPVDNPDTHLELTMIHEAMVLEYSGRSLGTLHLAAMVKQVLLAVLLANLFLPWGLDASPGLADYVAGGALLVLKVGAIGVGLAVVEMLFAKLRFYELPDLLGSASLAGFVAAAVAVLGR
jgi:formate hydrogenlyase subunit 4